MGDKIALGFHSCVDFELEWNKNKMEELITLYDIRNDELNEAVYIDSERNLLRATLAYMKEGRGCEFVPESNDIVEKFAEHFQYKITLGGTANRAAIAISKLGYESSLQLVCFNEVFQKLLPQEIHYLSSVGENNNIIYPHVILSYPSNEEIKVNDINFITPRENRIMYSCDADSLNMVISQEFGNMITDAEVMLVSCFSEVLDKEILVNRMKEVRALLYKLPQSAIVVFEDGCYINKDFRYYVHRQLCGFLDILSMNEDEMQEYCGRKIDIMNAQEVLESIEYIYRKIKVPTLIIHTANWAIAYGHEATNMEHILKGGIALSSARFQYGDSFKMAEWKETKILNGKEDGIAFGKRIMQLSKKEISCVPTKDLSFVKDPVVVGLGDFFVGGLLPELLIENRKIDKKER